MFRIRPLQLLTTLALVMAFGLGVVSAQDYTCEYEPDVSVSMLSNSFEAWKVVSDAMSQCGDFTAVLDSEFREKQVPAFAADPAQYEIGGVSNSTIIPLLQDGLIRPLDDLVEAYGQDLASTQRIVIDGNIMAIAMMINAQHLFYRTDVLDELGLGVPTTYDEVLAAAEAIQGSGLVDYPLGGTYAAGWNLGEEFVNMYLGFGGQFFDEDNMPTVNNEMGVAALEMMKALTQYMDPEYLTADSTVVQQQLQQGEIAMANLWASRAGARDDPEASEVVGLIGFAAAPSAVEGGPPATTLWWDGMTLARNITDEEATAAFQLMMEGLDHEVLSANPEAAIWLSSEPIDSEIAKGAVASAEQGAPAYPSSNVMGMMHTALGNNIADFLRGEESAEQTLSDIEDEYLAAAREAGVID